MAVASLVLGILSLICCSIVTGIPAIVFGHVARGNIKRNPMLTGGSMALAGLILGYLSVVFLPFVSALTVPAFTGALTAGQMAHDMSNQKQIHLALEQMAAEKPPGLPADAGIKTVEQLKARLIESGYLSAETAELLHFDRYLFGNVSASDPAETVVIRTKPGLYKNGGLVYMEKSGNGGRILNERRMEQMTAQDPPREPAYLGE